MTYSKKIVGFGDSITNGHDSLYGNWLGRVDAKMKEIGAEGFEFINCGHNGNTAANGIDRMEKELFGDLPATCVVEFGVNDCNVREWMSVNRSSLSEFKRNLKEIYRVITERGGSVIFVANHILAPDESSRFFAQGNGKTYMENLIPYNQAVREVAKELDAHLIDVEKYILDNNIDCRTMLRDDGVHLCEKGYEIYSDIIFEHLKELFDL